MYARGGRAGITCVMGMDGWLLTYSNMDLQRFKKIIAILCLNDFEWCPSVAPLALLGRLDPFFDTGPSVTATPVVPRPSLIHVPNSYHSNSTIGQFPASVAILNTHLPTI